MTFSRFGLVGFVVLAFAAVMNVGALSVAERNFAELRDAAMWVQRAQNAVTLIESIYRKAVDAETGQRGYLLTQDATFLAPYVDARLEIPKDLEKLRELTRDNPGQVAQLLTVQSLLDTRFAQIEESLALKRDRGDDAVREFLMSRRGQGTMDSLRRNLDGVAAEEGTPYERRIQAFGDNQDQVHPRLLLVAGLNLVLITVGGILLSQESRRRRRETGEVKQRNLQLAETVRERTAELSGLSHYLQQVQEEERARVARDIHDEMGGTLAAAKIDLQLLSDKLTGGDAQRTRLTRIAAAIDDTIQVKRRIIEELRPTLLDNLGIGAALKWQCSQFAKRWGTPCRVELYSESLRFSPAYGIALYRVVQESLTNISKHAQAKNVTVSLQRDGNQWVLRIVDDGVGIDTASPHHPTAHGLLSMRERARALGGEFSIQGQHGRGTVVEIRVPLEREMAT